MRRATRGGSRALRFKSILPVIIACGVGFVSLIRPVAGIPVAMPPELTLDLPLSEIPGVWRLTRLALLLGPSPMLWGYRKLSNAIEESKPSFRRTLLHAAGKIQEWTLNLAAEDDFEVDNIQELESEKSRRRNAASTAALILGTGMAVIPNAVLGVYKEILADPRLRRQRLRDSSVVLGGGPQLSLREMYQDYKKTLQLTLVVAREHIANAQLTPDHARLVQNMVLTRMEAR